MFAVKVEVYLKCKTSEKTKEKDEIWLWTEFPIKVGFAL